MGSLHNFPVPRPRATSPGKENISRQEINIWNAPRAVWRPPRGGGASVQLLQQSKVNMQVKLSFPSLLIVI